MDGLEWLNEWSRRFVWGPDNLLFKVCLCMFLFICVCVWTRFPLQCLLLVVIIHVKVFCYTTLCESLNILLFIPYVLCYVNRWALFCCSNQLSHIGVIHFFYFQCDRCYWNKNCKYFIHKCIFFINAIHCTLPCISVNGFDDTCCETFCVILLIIRLLWDVHISIIWRIKHLRNITNPVPCFPLTLIYHPATKGIILGMGLANEKRCYYETLSFIGWIHTQNDPQTNNSSPQWQSSNPDGYSYQTKPKHNKVRTYTFHKCILRVPSKLLPFHIWLWQQVWKPST